VDSNLNQQKSPKSAQFEAFCIENIASSEATGRGGGIRTPGTLRFNGFQDRRIRPLCHSSVFFLLFNPGTSFPENLGLQMY
jgi:hypothetical protein